jgi:hypothetical protein
MLDLLRRQYVVEKSRARLDRSSPSNGREDGSINIEDFGEKPETPESAPKKPEDWYETVKRWYERIDKWQKRLPDRRKPKPPREPGFQVDTTRGVDYPLRVEAILRRRGADFENLEISFEDEGSGQKLPGLEQWHDHAPQPDEQPNGPERALDDRAFRSGRRLEALVKGSLDLRGGGVRFGPQRRHGRPPGEPRREAFVGPSLPVKLKSGTVRVALQKLLVNGNESLDVAPVLIFRGLQIEPKDLRAGKLPKSTLRRSRELSMRLRASSRSFGLRI